MQLGYACINMTLAEQKPKIFTSRSMRQKTFKEKGLDYVSDLALQNVKDLMTIVQWNEAHGIKVFRMSSQIFPWITNYELSDLKDYDECCTLMKAVGDYATSVGQRLTFHPGPYNCLASPTQRVVDKTVAELNCHSEQMNMLGYKPSHYNKINIHVGGSYGDKEATLARFCKNFELLNDDTKARLVIENDDKASEYSVQDLHDHVYKHISTPITFDYYHHKFNTGGLSEEDALWLAAITWPDDVTQCCHYSESCRKEHNDDKIKAQAHSDLIYNEIHTYGLTPDIVVEAKHKELAVLGYREKYQTSLKD